MTPNASFHEAWEAAIDLCDVRGWDAHRDTGDLVHVGVPLLQGWFRQSFYKTPEGLSCLLHLMNHGAPVPKSTIQYKAIERYRFGFTEPREVYGTSI